MLAIDHWSLYDHDHGCDDANNDYLENQFVTLYKKSEGVPPTVELRISSFGQSVETTVASIICQSSSHLCNPLDDHHQ